MKTNKFNVMKRNIIYSLLLVIIISGCKVGPDYQRPDIKSPDAFRFGTPSTDSILNLKWWELFQDEVLIALIDTALKNNYDVKIAAARIEEARAVVGYKKADQFPSFGYEVSATGSNLLGNEQTDTYGSFFIGPNVNWEIDFWGKYRRYSEAARADLLGTQYSYRTIQLSLISEVASTYFLLLSYDSRLNISQQTLASRKESLRIIQERFNEGIIPEIDLNQAQMQEADADASVPFYTRNVAISENALSILLGQNPGPILGRSTLIDQSIPPEIPQGIPYSLLQRRPDVLAAEQNLVSQNAMIGAAQAMRLPTINLSGFFGLASPQINTLFAADAMVWSLGGSLMGPIFNFGKNKRNVEIEKHRMQQDSLTYVLTVLQAFQDVDDALIQISTYKNEVEARNRMRDAALNANKLSKERYDGGVTSYLEVLDSERSLFDAELSAAKIYQEQLNSYINLYKALGGGWIKKQ